jgi:hypothetical protein
VGSLDRGRDLVCVGPVDHDPRPRLPGPESEAGDRQVVIMANSVVMSEETWEALGRLTWASYCS